MNESSDFDHKRKKRESAIKYSGIRLTVSPSTLNQILVFSFDVFLPLIDNRAQLFIVVNENLKKKKRTVRRKNKKSFYRNVRNDFLS